MNKNLVAILFAAALAVSARAVPATAFLVNGGFETGNLTGWTLAGSQIQAFVLDKPDFSNYTHSGNYGLDWYGSDPFPGDTLSQTIATTPGLAYTLEFWWFSEVFGYAPNNFGAQWNGQSVFTTSFTTSSGINDQWTDEKLTVIAAGTSTVLTFANYVQPGHGTYGLDDISLTPIAAPEPATNEFLAIAGLLVISSRFRHKHGANSSPQSASPE